MLNDSQHKTTFQKIQLFLVNFFLNEQD